LDLAPGPAEEDELYEMYMAEATKIYGLKGDQLILLDTGFLPTYDLLSSKKVNPTPAELTVVSIRADDYQ